MSRFETYAVANEVPCGDICDVAIVGAGPYGLSLAAHLQGSSVSYRIFGKPMAVWQNHMPKDMRLKSEGFASNLSAPAKAGTLKTFCEERGFAYADRGVPVTLDVFNAYAAAFQARFVPNLEPFDVVRLEKSDAGFRLWLENGVSLEARKIVLATGITGSANMPEVFSPLPRTMRSHSFQHREGGQFHRRDVVIVGAGASAIDLAAYLTDCGATVRIVARSGKLVFHSPPSRWDTNIIRQIFRPVSVLGAGWRSLFCAAFPGLFRTLPAAIRLRAALHHPGPAAGWFLRERLEGRIETSLGTEIIHAAERHHRAHLTLVDRSGHEHLLICDHVIAATGYRPDLNRLSFLPPRLVQKIAHAGTMPVLSRRFETSMHGIYVIGPAAAGSFGPLMRFVAGTGFAAPRLARHFRRMFRHNRRVMPTRTPERLKAA